jgi:hypothetical protein
MSLAPGAKLYEPAVVCAKRECTNRLTVAAVNGGSRHCSRQCAGFVTREEVAAVERREPGYLPPCRRKDRGSPESLGADDPDDELDVSDAELAGVEG